MVQPISDHFHVRLNQLKDLLERQDWYYHFSEDQSVWAKGNELDAQIDSLVKSLGRSGIDLYNQYSPDKWRESNKENA